MNASKPARVRRPQRCGLAFAVGLIALFAGCGGGGDALVPEAVSAAPRAAPSGLDLAALPSPIGAVDSMSTPQRAMPRIDPMQLPVGDYRYSSSRPAVGSVFVCNINFPGGGATVPGPWFTPNGTWNSVTKQRVRGAVQWWSSLWIGMGNGVRNVVGNGLPAHPTGVFPISPSDPAYGFDRNPNTIAPQAIAFGLPPNPQVAPFPSCLPPGAIGVLLTGARLFNALDAGGRDAAAWEVLDDCEGHPEVNGQYHYHTVTRCGRPDQPGQHSPLAGFAIDGFGIYGNLGERGQPLTNFDLDDCHGHSHALNVDGRPVVQYHYHATHEYPYTVGCLRATPPAARAPVAS